MKGIDISSHNGNVDFQKIKTDGIQAIYIKATEGVNFVDNKFKENADKAQNSGMNYGFYHFMSERTSPTQQAMDFFNTIKGYKYTLTPCLDIESNSLGRNATQISDRCIEFLNKFKELSGQDCIIYTGAYFGRDNLDSRVKKYKGWIAHYGVSTPMATGFTVVGHQYSETGKVKGVGGNCDINNFDNAILLNKSRQNFKITATANIESYGIKNYSGINHILIGTTGQGKRLEAISINIDGIDFSYLVHVQGLGDVGGSIKGQVLGTIGEKIRLEGIAFNVKSIPKGYKLLYRTHIEKQGWGKWCNAGQYSGTKGKGLRMEAVEIKIE